jgi:hypothetical protein
VRVETSGKVGWTDQCITVVDFRVELSQLTVSDRITRESQCRHVRDTPQRSSVGHPRLADKLR